MRLRLFRIRREAVAHDLDVIAGDEYEPSPTMRAWRRVRALVATTRRSWPGFAFHAGANAVGTLTAIAVVYLVGIAAGVVTAVPLAVIVSVAAVAVAVIAAVFRLAPRRLLMARASELLDAEPGRVVATLKKIFVADDVDDFDIFDVVWDCPSLTERSWSSALANP